jgi:hypothetical protein
MAKGTAGDTTTVDYGYDGSFYDDEMGTEDSLFIKLK